MARPSTKIVGERPSTLDGNRPPVADITKEYLAGGSSVFPLAGQVAISHASDDLSRDLGVRIYETMLNDPTVSAGFYALLMTALNGPMQLIHRVKAEAGEEVTDPEKAKDIADADWAVAFCERAAKRPRRSFKATLYDLGHAWAFGVKLAEIRLEWGDGEDENYLTLASLKVKPNASWSFVVDPDQEVVAIRGTTIGGGYEDLPPQLFVILSTLGRDGDPRGRSILRGAYNGWNLKLNTWPKYYRYLDLHAVPITVGITAPDAQAQQAEDVNGVKIPGVTWSPTTALYNMLGRLKTGSFAAMPNGADLKVVQASGNGEAFRQAIDLFKHEILEGILLTGQSLLEAKHSSKANNESSADVVGNLIAFLRDEFATIIHTQLFHRILTINKGREFADKFTPEVSLGRVEERDRVELITAFSTAGWSVSPSQFPAIDAEVKIKVRDPEEVKKMTAAKDAADAAAAMPPVAPVAGKGGAPAEKPPAKPKPPA